MENYSQQSMEQPELCGRFMYVVLISFIAAERTICACMSAVGRL